MHDGMMHDACSNSCSMMKMMKAVVLLLYQYQPQRIITMHPLLTCSCSLHAAVVVFHFSLLQPLGAFHLFGAFLLSLAAVRQIPRDDHYNTNNESTPVGHVVQAFLPFLGHIGFWALVILWSISKRNNGCTPQSTLVLILF